VQAKRTVSFFDTKTVMFANRVPKKECGEIVVKDIGIPPAAYQMVGPGDMLRYPVPLPFWKKGDMGKVLVIGGGPFTGAPALSAMGAIKAGADLVRLLVPDAVAGTIASFSPDLMVSGVGEHGSRILEFSAKDQIEEGLDWADVVLIGPGAGKMDETLDMLVIAMERGLALGKKLVVDADGLHALSQALDSVSGGDIIVTPHRGEMKQLLLGMGMDSVPDPTIDDPFAEWYIEMMARLSIGNKLTILHKGHKDVIMGLGTHGLGEHIERTTPFGKVVMRINDSGHPWMTKGGTGDVLAGLSAGLMARGMMPFDAACLAAFINGKAGQVVFERKGYSSTATDLLDAISITI
jgi:NAD(P)H-hydrate epimerase